MRTPPCISDQVPAHRQTIHSNLSVLKVEATSDVLKLVMQVVTSGVTGERTVSTLAIPVLLRNLDLHCFSLSVWPACLTPRTLLSLSQGVKGFAKDFLEHRLSFSLSPAQRLSTTVGARLTNPISTLQLKGCLTMYVGSAQLPLSLTGRQCPSVAV